MNTIEKQLFHMLDKISRDKFRKFERYYKNDSKQFINKISRDYQKTQRFPLQVIKAIKNIPHENYDSAVCILRGALPYSVIFEAFGWKVHYVLCGRKNEKIVRKKEELRFNKNIDLSIKQISKKKVLLIDNNSFSGNTPIRTMIELRKYFKIKKPDLFLDYFCYPYLFMNDKKKQNLFGKIYLASKERRINSIKEITPLVKPSKEQEKKLKIELLEKLKNVAC